MGNRQLNKPVQEREEDEEEDDDFFKQKKNKKKAVQIQPYNHDAVDTGFVSPIKGYLPQEQEQELFVKRPEQLKNKDIVDYVIDLEKKFDDPNNVDEIMQNFMKDSRENVIGKMKFLRFIWNESELMDEKDDLSVDSQQDSSFVQLFFKSCLKVIDSGDTGQFMDYSKLLNIVYLMKCGKKSDQLEFFFSLFDTNSDGKIEREELNYFYTIFFEFLLQASFIEKDRSVEKLREEIQKNKEKDIAAAIKSMSYEINQKYCNREGHLTYESWQKLMQKEYLEDIYGPDDIEQGERGEIDGSGEIQDRKQKKQTNSNSNQNDQSFSMDASSSINHNGGNANVFTNARQNTYNQTLSTETNKKEEQQMLFKDKKDIFI